MVLTNLLNRFIVTEVLSSKFQVRRRPTSQVHLFRFSGHTSGGEEGFNPDYEGNFRLITMKGVDRKMKKAWIVAVVLFMVIISNLGYAEVFKFPEVDPSLSVYERQKSFQIPNEKLQEMTTADLIETCMRYYGNCEPILAFWPNVDVGMRKLLLEFNGYQELINRDDGPSFILEEYKKLNPTNFKKRTEKDWHTNYKDDSCNLIVLEYLLRQDYVFHKLLTNEKRELAQHLLLVFDSELGGHEKGLSFGYTVNSTLQTMLNFVPFKIRERLNIHEKKDVDIILNEISKWINK